MKNTELDIKSEWSHLGYILCFIFGLYVFAVVGLSLGDHFLEDHGSPSLKESILFQSYRLWVPFTLGTSFVFLYFFWHRIRTWQISGGTLYLFFLGRPTKSIRLSEIGSLSYDYGRLMLYPEQLKKYHQMFFVSRYTAMQAIDLWVLERNKKRTH